MFLLFLRVLLASLITGALSSALARDYCAPTQVGGLVVFALVLGASLLRIADGLGTLTGLYLVLAGGAALFSLALSVPTAALARIHPIGTAVAGLTFVIVGVPSTGGRVGLAQFLPSFFRFVSPILPPSVAIPVLTNIMYFAALVALTA